MPLTIPKKLEFGNPVHIAILKEGERLAKFLEKDYVEAQEADFHACDCELCDEKGYRCPECRFGLFESIPNCTVPDGHCLTKIVTRRFCRSCDTEVIF